jgi:adenylate cyclase
MAQLIDARSDTQQWAEHYDRDLANVFAIQGEIAKAIADQLQAKLSPQEKARVEQVPTASTEAYVLYLRASQIRLNPDNLLQEYKAAEQLYLQAISYDPNFALAHARLASTRAQIFHYYEPTDGWRTKARTEAEIALRLQPNLAKPMSRSANAFPGWIRITTALSNSSRSLLIYRRATKTLFA